MAKKRGRGFCTKTSSCWIPGPDDDCDDDYDDNEDYND